MIDMSRPTDVHLARSIRTTPEKYAVRTHIAGCNTLFELRRRCSLVIFPGAFPDQASMRPPVVPAMSCLRVMVLMTRESSAPSQEYDATRSGYERTGEGEVCSELARFETILS